MAAHLEQALSSPTVAIEHVRLVGTRGLMCMAHLMARLGNMAPALTSDRLLFREDLVTIRPRTGGMAM